MTGWFTTNHYFQTRSGSLGEFRFPAFSQQATFRTIDGRELEAGIESIDVSNFAARKSTSMDRPHIVFNVKDGTKVYWGAAWGQAATAFEADDKTKLDRLYQWFMEHNNTLQGTVKIIELRWLEDGVPRPR